MKKINTSPISGMQEFLPAEAARFERVKSTIAETYRRHGFMQIETPVIDRCEILLAKAGGDTEKQIYKVVKTAEAAEGADQALRFDHTVPLARYVVEHENDLTFPFKVTQIGRNFRGERAQKGRFREFYQCDVDVIGRGSLPLFYDADVLCTALDALRALHLPTPVMARVSNRKILTGAIEALNLQNVAAEIYSIIDHSEKVPMEKTMAALDALGIMLEAKEKILRLMNLNGAEALEDLRDFGISGATFEEGVTELSEVMRLVAVAGLSDMAAVDLRIVRGLDYYTGTVFEFCLPEYMGVGSVGGGGRYENLAGHFTDLALPGVGASIGLSRLYYILCENDLLKASLAPANDVAVVPISDNELEYALSVAKDLRLRGRNVTVVALDKRLGDKMKYAAAVAKAAIVLGPDEVASGKYEIKEFK